MTDEDTDHDIQEPHQNKGIDRRRFVKGSAGAASMAVAAAAGFGMFRQAAVTGNHTIRFIDYLGAAVAPSSPAPRGLPFIPVRVNEQGYVEALPELDGTNHLDRLRYCGYQNAANLREGATNDNVLRYFLPEDKIIKAAGKASEYWWYLDRLGDTVHASHFQDLPHGSGASVRWRSEGVGAADTVTLLLLKLDPLAFKGPHRDAITEFMDNRHDLIGISAICTHFCCVPGYKESEGAHQFNAWDLVYCTCHHSRFDPYEPREYNFMLREPQGG